MSYKIYDCFPFFNELDLLEIRLNELNDFVDYFVLVESTKTHSGKDKELFFENNKLRFEKFLPKIRHLVLKDNDIPDYRDFYGNMTDNPIIEYAQINYMINALFDAQEDDIVLMLGADEIINKKSIDKNKKHNELSSIEMDLYYYNLNCKCTSKWREPKLFPFRFLKEKSFTDLRYNEIATSEIKNGGWHFSYFGGKEKILEKLESFFPGTYYRNPEFLEKSHIEECVGKNKDIYNRKEISFEKKPYDNIPYEMLDRLERFFNTNKFEYKYSIIIPTYNHVEDCLKPCIESIIKYTDLSKTEVIVVANGCTDSTREYISDINNLSIRLLWFDEPLGYPKANNEALKIANGEYVVFLNNDIILLPQEKNYWLDMLTYPFLNDMNIGMTGCLVTNYTGVEKSFVHLSCAMTKLDIINEIGVLDEDFSPGGLEDVDFSFRLQNRGYAIKQVPEEKCSNTNGVYCGGFPICHIGNKTFENESGYKKSIEKNAQKILNKHCSVSIIMPVYNSQNTLQKTIQSILNQTFEKWELFVTDDCSTDNSLSILKEFSKKDGRIHVFEHMKNKGVSAARNTCIEMIQERNNSDYIAYCDSDDIWTPIHLSESLMCLKNCDMVYSDGFYIDAFGNLGSSFGIPYYDDFNYEKILTENFILISSVVHKRKCLSVGYFDSDLNSIEDWDYWNRIVENGYKVFHNKNKQIYYVFREKSMASMANENLIQKCISKRKLRNIKIRVLSVCHNEEKILPYFLKHYSSFCDEIVIYDNNSTDSSREIIKRFPKATIIPFDTHGKFDEETLMQIRNNGYKENREQYDWQIVVDIDQFIYHPNIVQKLKEYKQKCISIPLIKGYEMYSDFFPTEDRQIYEIIKTGKHSQWLDICAVFNPSIDINYGPGNHSCSPIGDIKYSDNSVIKLLHYRFLSYEYLVYKCQKAYSELSENNKKNGYGFHYEEFMKIKPEEFKKELLSCRDVVCTRKIFDHFNLKEQKQPIYNEIFEMNQYGLKQEDVENKTVIDIWANVGFFTIMCYEHNAKEILCYEPNIIEYKNLLKNVNGINEIRTFNEAVFDNIKTEIEITNQDVCSNVYGVFDVTNSEKFGQVEKKTVPCTSLQKIIDGYNLKDKTIVLKLDCEAAEYDILLNTPKQYFEKIETIFIEMHDDVHPNNHYTIKFLYDYICSLGYADVHKGAQFGVFYDNGKRFEPFPVVIHKFKKIHNNIFQKQPKKVSIIIPTYNHLEDCLKPCLTSIIQTTDLNNVEVIVVANGCVDGTKDYVLSLGEPFKLLWIENKNGYTKSINEGLKQATGDYIILLNNDTQIRNFNKHEWIESMINQFEQDDKMGLVGMEFSWSCEINKQFAIFYCVMISRRTLNEIGLLDEIFSPGFGEDIDYCMKVLEAGYKIECVGGPAYPISHSCSLTFHDEEHREEYERIVQRNQEILRNRYLTLNSIGTKHGTDKGSEKGLNGVDGHNYLKLYDKYFKSKRFYPINLLEIGVYKGWSLKMWEEYFLYGNIYGLDIDENLKEIETERIHFYQCDQTNNKQLNRFKEQSGKHFDFIIDDGCHCQDGQQISFGSLFPILKEGCIYVIEDIQHYKYGNWGIETSDDFANSTLKILENFQNTGIFNSVYLTKNQNKYIQDNIDEIFISQNDDASIIAFIKKR